MFPKVPTAGLTLPKVIGGISKTLNVANQIIPLYMQAKPMIKNAKNAFYVAKEVLQTPAKPATKKKSPTIVKKTQLPKKEEITPPLQNANNPVFFV